MLGVVSAKMGEQSPPSEINTLSDLACAIIINQILFHSRVEDFITEGVFYDSVLYLLACNRAHLTSLMQDKMCVWQKLIGHFGKLPL